MDIHKFVYAVKNMVFTINKQNYEFEDGMCLYLTIRHDYLNRRLPLIQIGIQAYPDIIGLFYQYKNDAVLRIDVYEYELDENGNTINTKLYLRHAFQCIAARDQTSYITTPNDETKELIDEMRKLQGLELYLIDMDYVNKFSQETSMILDNCSKAGCLQAIFMNREVPDKTVIATPPMYDEIIPSINIPLGDLVQSVYTLNTKYGLYNSQPILYYDYEYLYCINSVDPNIIFKQSTEFGTVTFILLNYSKQEHNAVGSITDPVTKCHYTNLQIEPTIHDVEDHDTSTQFATVLGINSDGTVNKTTLNNTDTKLKYIREYNDLTHEQTINEQMPGHVVIVHTNSCCVSFLKPYKRYIFDVDTQFSDRKLAGYDYRLTGYTLDLQREDREHYTSSITISLRANQRATGQNMQQL